MVLHRSSVACRTSGRSECARRAPSRTRPRLRCGYLHGCCGSSAASQQHTSFRTGGNLPTASRKAAQVGPCRRAECALHARWRSRAVTAGLMRESIDSSGPQGEFIKVGSHHNGPHTCLQGGGTHALRRLVLRRSRRRRVSMASSTLQRFYRRPFALNADRMPQGGPAVPPPHAIWREGACAATSARWPWGHSHMHCRLRLRSPPLDQGHHSCEGAAAPPCRCSRPSPPLWARERCPPPRSPSTCWPMPAEWCSSAPAAR